MTGRQGEQRWASARNLDRDLARRLEAEASKYPEHLRSLGEISATFALLELCLSSFVWSLLGVEERLGLCVTAPSSFGNLCISVSALFQERQADENLRAELTAILKRAREVEEPGNRPIHSFWAKGEATDVLVRMKATARQKSGLGRQQEPMRVADLQAVADEILAVTSDLHTFKKRLGYTVGDGL